MASIKVRPTVEPKLAKPFKKKAPKISDQKGWDRDLRGLKVVKRMFTKYFELGLALIPVKRGNKNPIINGWQQYCKTKPTVEQITYWEHHHKGCNYGLPLGPANGIVALDIDTDNPITLKMCPQSPLVKRGAKGETRFFRYHSKVKTTKLFQKSKGVEILSDGTQTIIPPSVHPDTKKPYFWLSKDTLENFDINDLPILETSFLQTLPRIDGRDKITKEIYQGRNDKLKSMAVAALNNFKGIEEVARELLEFDQESHSPPLFSDTKEPSNKSKNPYDNALRFVRSVHKTVETSLKKLPIIELAESDKKEEASTLKPLPEPEGLLKLIRDYVARNSIKDQPEFALCTALHIVSAFACGRFELNGTHPILFSIVLGEPGSGKDDIVSQTRNILTHDAFRDYNLMGAGSYASSVALCQGLVEQRSRLDVIDEFSSFLADSTKKEGHASGVVTILNELYSSPGRFFSGPPRAITRKEAYCCESPFVNMIGLIQPKQFIQKIHSDHLDNGFLSRCLFFRSNPDAKTNEAAINRRRDDGLETVIEDLKLTFPNRSIFPEKVTKISGQLPPYLIGPATIQLLTEPGLDQVMIKLFQHYDSRRQDLRDNDVAQSLLVRAFEKVKKTAMICCISDWVIKGNALMTQKHLEWAKDLVDTTLINNLSIVEQATGPKGRALLSKEIEDFISGKKIVQERYIHNKFRAFETRFRRDALDDLVNRGVVEKGSATINGQTRTILRFLSSSNDILLESGSKSTKESVSSLAESQIVSKNEDSKKIKTIKRLTD